MKKDILSQLLSDNRHVNISKVEQNITKISKSKDCQLEEYNLMTEIYYKKKKLKNCLKKVINPHTYLEWKYYTRTIWKVRNKKK
jgi:tRNA/tmRNA/rRNA uracil-C5-methylase (TrmA/RlmC/RlmD family)